MAIIWYYVHTFLGQIGVRRPLHVKRHIAHPTSSFFKTYASWVNVVQSAQKKLYEIPQFLRLISSILGLGMTASRPQLGVASGWRRVLVLAIMLMFIQHECYSCPFGLWVKCSGSITIDTPSRWYVPLFPRGYCSLTNNWKSARMPSNNASEGKRYIHFTCLERLSVTRLRKQE